MQLQSPIPGVPTNIPTGKPITHPCCNHHPTYQQPAHATGIKPTTLPANSSKRKRHCKQQAARVHNAKPPTSPTLHIRTQAQVVTVAAQVPLPFFEHTFMNTTVGCAAANTSTRLCHSSYETAMASTRTRVPHMPHHTTGKQCPSSNGSNGQGHGQVPQLQATNEQPKIKIKHGAYQQPTNLGNWQMASEVA
jgi:hypothetical protein